MKIYIAAKFKDKDKVKKLNAFFKKKGFKLSGDWTDHVQVKPYDKEPKRSKEYAIEDISSSINCDVFIVLTNEDGGTGCATELGAAIGSYLISKKPKIYVVGKHLGVNMFYFHPSVNRGKTIDEVIEEL
jgi:hypothetical protein